MRGVHLLIAAVLAAGFCPIFAQTDRGTIEGLVTDTTGAAVPNAQIQVVQIETNATFQFASNDLGRYFAANLPLGTYRVVIQKAGFRAARREPILIQAQTRARVDIALELGAVTETVDVTGEAPMLDASTATLATGLTTKFIEELPLITIGRKRDIASFLRYLPGLTRDSVGSPRLNGSAGRDTEVFIDGAPASQVNTRGGIEEAGPAVEHVGEFSVITNAFNAEYGRTGSWLTNITIRSGTNELHGSVFNYFANDKLNARSFFQNVRTRVRQNEGGFTIGGPAYLPKIYDGRNRTFFFFGQDLFWNRQTGVGNLLTIPRDDFRRGDFSSLRDASGNMIPIYDPATTRPDGKGSFVRDPFQGNLIPAARVSSASRQIVALMPQPDLPQLQSENWYNRTGAHPNFDTWVSTLKVDHNVSARQKIAVTYSDQTRPRLIAGRGWGKQNLALEGFQRQHIDTRTGRINHDFIFRPNLLSHFTFGIDRYANPARTLTVGENWNEKLEIRGLPWDNGAFPYVTFTGGTAVPITMSDYRNSFTGNGRVTFNENLTWVRGRHSLKFGFAYYREYQNSFEAGYGPGEYQFSNVTTSQPNAGSNFGRWGHSFASFLLGEVNRAQTRSSYTVGWRWRYSSLFAQDEWRIGPKLTLSYGLRWEFFPGVFEVHDRFSSFDPATPNPGAGGLPGALIFAGTGPGRLGRRNLSDNWRRGVAPRLGVAYELNRKSVVRASGGMYYAPSVWPMYSIPGFVANPIFGSPDGFSPSYNWKDIFPQSFARPPFIDPTFQNDQNVPSRGREAARAPQILSWTFSLERELLPNLALDVSYLGSHSTHLVARQLGRRNVVDAKYLSLGPVLTQSITSSAAAAAGVRSPFAGFQTYRNNTVAQALKPFPQYVDIDEEYGPIGAARFNSLQIKATRRSSHGLTMLAFYTWMKNLTNAEDGAMQYPLNRVGEMSVSSDGAPHVFVTSVVYDLPFGAGKRFLPWGGIAGRLVGGWQLVAYVRAASGDPLSVTVSNNLSVLGYPNKRADYVAGQPVHITSNPRDFDPARDLFLNPAAFAIPGSYALGNTARVLDSARGWTRRSQAISIGKRTRIAEKVSAMLRADMENPFNLVRWSNPVTNRSDSKFGRVNSSEGGRTIQLSLAVEF